MGVFKRLCLPFKQVRGVSAAASCMEHCTAAACSLEDHFIPPEAVRGCRVLDRDAFCREFELPAIRLAYPSLCSSFLKRLAHACLRFPTLKSVQTEPSKDGKVRKHVLWALLLGG